MKTNKVNYEEFDTFFKEKTQSYVKLLTTEEMTESEMKVAFSFDLLQEVLRLLGIEEREKAKENSLKALAKLLDDQIKKNKE